MENICVICNINPLIKPARKYCKPCKIELHRPKSGKTYPKIYQKKPENGKIAMPKFRFNDTKKYDWDMINKLPKGGDY